MILYVVAFEPKGKIVNFKKAIETSSITEINKWIMANPYKDDVCFPLLSSNDKDKLIESGRTILLFSNWYYYLVDVSHKDQVAVIRHINIETILN